MQTFTLEQGYDEYKHVTECILPERALSKCCRAYVTSQGAAEHIVTLPVQAAKQQICQVSLQSCQTAAQV